MALLDIEYITKDELGKTLDGSKIRWTHFFLLKDIIRKTDFDDDGKISWDEFQKSCHYKQIIVWTGLDFNRCNLFRLKKITMMRLTESSIYTRKQLITIPKIIYVYIMYLSGRFGTILKWKFCILNACYSFKKKVLMLIFVPMFFFS